MKSLSLRLDSRFVTSTQQGERQTTGRFDVDRQAPRVNYLEVWEGSELRASYLDRKVGPLHLRGRDSLTLAAGDKLPLWMICASAA
jgi:hypothetical protein